MSYPETAQARNAWVTALRGTKAPVDRRRPVGWFVEDEREADGAVRPVFTVLLANRECPWKCVYCDLWRHTLDTGVQPGDIPEQIRIALVESLEFRSKPRTDREPGSAGILPAFSDSSGFIESVLFPSIRTIKLYNAGSFFDAAAIPTEDHAAIAGLARGFRRVIVECHPALVGPRVFAFRDLLRATEGDGPGAELEVALGLETADAAVLERMNKGLTLPLFRAATARLRDAGIHVRAFVLVQPPFSESSRAVSGAVESAAFALDCGVEVVSLIPTRPGNGALDRLRSEGAWAPPRLEDLEAAHEQALAMAAGRGRIFADTWELAPFADCEACRGARVGRLRRMNDTQHVEPRLRCGRCGAGERAEILA